MEHLFCEPTVGGECNVCGIGYPFGLIGKLTALLKYTIGNGSVMNWLRTFVNELKVIGNMKW